MQQCIFLAPNHLLKGTTVGAVPSTVAQLAKDIELQE